MIGTTDRWIMFSPNPAGRSVGDCTVRAICAAFDISWYEAYDLLCAKGREMCDMPSSDAVWGAVLKEHGFRRAVIPNLCPECYTADDFCAEHTRGIYVLGFGGHVATVKHGYLYDSWCSIKLLPQFYWHR